MMLDSGFPISTFTKPKNRLRLRFQGFAGTVHNLWSSSRKDQGEFKAAHILLDFVVRPYCICTVYVQCAADPRYSELLEENALHKKESEVISWPPNPNLHGQAIDSSWHMVHMYTRTQGLETRGLPVVGSARLSLGRRRPLRSSILQQRRQPRALNSALGQCHAREERGQAHTLL